jgi:hypothetical protein
MLVFIVSIVFGCKDTKKIRKPKENCCKRILLQQSLADGKASRGLTLDELPASATYVATATDAHGNKTTFKFIKR